MNLSLRPHSFPTRWYFLIIAAGLATDLAAQQVAHPVEQDPDHMTVLKNEYVQAFRVTLPAGKSNQMHTHSHDDATVLLSEATISNEALGLPVPQARHVLPGTVSVRDNGAKPLTHRIHNMGATVFDVIDVQILKRPAGPEAPAISTPAAESPKFRMYRYELAPGAHGTQHTHTRPYVTVAATDMALRVSSPEADTIEHGVKAGDIQWFDTPVTHTLTNSGTTRGVFVEIELK